jgi:hypothetical protein
MAVTEDLAETVKEIEALERRIVAVVRTPMVNSEVTYQPSRTDVAQPGQDDAADALLGYSAMRGCRR